MKAACGALASSGGDLVQDTNSLAEVLSVEGNSRSLSV